MLAGTVTLPSLSMYGFPHGNRVDRYFVAIFELWYLNLVLSAFFIFFSKVIMGKKNY